MIKKSNTLSIGYRLLDKYRIEAVLGAGGFGITYMAVHEALLKRVAIKEYFPVEWSYRDGDHVLANTQGGLPTSEAGEDACYTWGLERFLNEAQTLVRVEHPGVVRVQDYFQSNGTAYIVMDYVDGEPLSQILQREKTLPEEQVRRLIDDVLPALEAVHAQGYLHRDLKPANLYRRSDGRTILIDFGAARQALGRRSKSVTSVFSPGYSPIEQYLIDGKGYGPWTDIYALGTVLYHCVTGAAPIEAPARVLDDPLQPAEEVAAGRYGSVLLRLIDRAIAVRPEKRFQTISQMRAALEAPLEEEERTVKLELPLRSEVHRSGEKFQPVIDQPVRQSSSALALSWQGGKRRRVMAAGLGLFAVIVAIGAGLWIVQTPTPSMEQPPVKPLPPVESVTKGPPANPQAGQTYTDTLTGMDFIWIAPDCFSMGSPETEPDRSANEVLHHVCLKGFWMGKTEVTNDQYRQFQSNHDSGAYESYTLNAPAQPVVRVSWQEAVTYAGWLSEKTGLRYRLPTEAEWEFAARAGQTGSRYWGNDPNQACRYANIYDETARKAKPFNWANYPCEDHQAAAAAVGQYAANTFGLYDMLGNVAEWTCSEYDSAYAGGETRCAEGGASSTGRRVLRGGSWSDYPGLVRFAYRFPAAPEYGKWRSDIGFRLVLEP
ncbi:MAG TPA: bifunctional serine/threonine-protein kinase/formylglycine-generating enzyme family protein [Candidatus Competibacteraceae bacterium]|nr:bifunctional serine/threonine-protein kinase/formylglycine-generating enzyme family protein [Candidatus Competibacteraceae bacterium]